MCFNLGDLKKIIFFQVNVALTLIKDNTFITSTWKRLAGGGVKFARCLRVLWFLNNRSVFEMKGRWGGGSENSTAWKVSKYGVFSGPQFPAFRLNTERYGVSLRIQSECEKIWTRKNSVFGHFSRIVCLLFFFFFCRSHKSMTPKEI